MQTTTDDSVKELSVWNIFSGVSQFFWWLAKYFHFVAKKVNGNYFSRKWRKFIDFVQQNFSFLFFYFIFLVWHSLLLSIFHTPKHDLHREIESRAKKVKKKQQQHRTMLKRILCSSEYMVDREWVSEWVRACVYVCAAMSFF